MVMPPGAFERRRDCDCQWALADGAILPWVADGRLLSEAPVWVSVAGTVCSAPDSGLPWPGTVSAVGALLFVPFRNVGSKSSSRPPRWQ